MMKRLTVFILLALCAAAPGWAKELTDAEKAEKSVRDYEERIERIAGEVETIREELEALAREMVEGETGRVLIFMKGKASDWSDRGLSLALDGKVIFSRPLSTSELDVLSRGLALELFEVRLTSGEHAVNLYEMGTEAPEPVSMIVKRAAINAWTVNIQDENTEWTAQ